MPSQSVEARRAKILQKLNDQEKVYVHELAIEFRVTTETIRRDLDILDQEGSLKKIFGGAIKRKDNRLELYHEDRSSHHKKEKAAIAKAASSFIEDGDILAIQGGSTTEELIPYLLPHHHLTVITNSLPIAYTLLAHQKSGDFDGQLLLLGGEVRTASMASSGYFAEDMLSKLSFNKVFLSCAGLTRDGVSTYLSEHIRLSQMLIRKSALAILMADSSKINTQSLYTFAPLSSISTVISNAEMPSHWKDTDPLSTLEWIVART